MAAGIVVFSLIILIWQLHGRGSIRADRSESLLLFVILVSILTLLLFAIVLYRLYLSISRPVEELAHGIRRYWAGEFSTRVPISGRNELGYLQQSFNEMAEKIERMLIELQQLDELKTEFISTVSHELRTPLTSIGGYVKVVLSEDAGSVNDTQREFLEIVDRNVDRLGRLIDDLLDAEKMVSGRFEVKKERNALGPVLADCVQTVAVIAKKKGLSIHLPSVPAEIEVLAERPRLFQIFMNLLHNAVKYTDTGGVEISVQVTDFSAIVRLKDSDIGLTEDERRQIFDRFYRTRSGLSSSESGTGLGLTIVRGLVESFGGQVLVESAPGQGTTFTVSLPLAPRHGEGDPVGAQVSEPRVLSRPVWVVDSDRRSLEIIREALVEPRGPLEGWHLRTRVFSSIQETPLVGDRLGMPSVVILGVGKENEPDQLLVQEFVHKLGNSVSLILIGNGELTGAWLGLGVIGWLARPISSAGLYSALYEALSQRQGRVLIADPDTDLRLLLRRGLEQKGIRADDVELGKEAIARIAREPYDLVILDSELQDFSIGELLHLIGEAKVQSTVSVCVVVTDEPSEARVAELLSQGFFAVFSKAKGLARLTESIRKAIS